jgi:RNA-directed DNA polymerase
MLRIQRTSHLLEALRTTAQQVNEVIESPADYYEELVLRDPQKPDKLRTVVNVTGLMRALQQNLYRRVLLPKLQPSVYSHGGVVGRSIKTNAEPHLPSIYGFRADISNFYPSVHYSRVYRLFVEGFKCSPDVSRICTKIATFRHHLALGLITSPILADQILRRVDRRVGGACAKIGLIYTRYVDDITISGDFDLQRSGVPALVERILAEDGFQANPGKHKFGQLGKDLTITNLRLVRGHLDVRREYAEELVRQLDDAASLARDEAFEGPYYTPGQILGRVRFVCWVNPGRKRELVRRFRSIRWDLVRQRAVQRRYEESRPTLTKLTNRQGETKLL